MRRALFETLAFLAFVLALCLLYSVLKGEPAPRAPIAPADMPGAIYNPNRVLII